MTNVLNNFFGTVFGDNIILATILISMVPIIELRGAIPFATNTGIWKSVAMNNWQAFGWSLLGSSLVVPIVALIFIPIINWLKRTKLFGKFANAVENRIRGKAETISGTQEKSARFSPAYWKKMLAVFVFVAIPLPLTGVWTGTCVAVFLGLGFVSVCAAVVVGNIVAGLLITLILQFFPALNNYLFYIFLIIVALVLVYEIIKHIIEKRNRTSQD